MAALAVLFFHIATCDLFKHDPGWLAPWNILALHIGFLGVEIFFVISGFVITYSLRDARVTGRFVGTFALRRSLRLDPPCWAAIFLTLLVSVVFTRFLHATQYPIPTAGTLAANLFYVQGILHKPSMLVVLWTLCDEVQFYLFFILLQFAAQRFTRSAGAASRLLTVLLLLTGSASLLAYVHYDGADGYGGSAVNWWYLFAFGALLCRQMLERGRGMGIAAALVLLATGLFVHGPEPVAGAITGIALLAAMHRQALSTWLSSPVWQYFGRISYSLYLLHTLVLQVLASVLLHVRIATAFHCVPAYALLLGVPVATADIFYRLVERPSHQLAVRFGRRNALRVAAGGVEVVDMKPSSSSPAPVLAD